MERRNLPWDLIEEILSRVPAKSLARLRSTSKPWNTLLKSRIFAKLHSANAPKESLIIMLMMDSKVYLARVRWTQADPFDTSRIRNNVAPSVKVASQFYLEKMHFISSHIRNVFHCDGLLLCTTWNNELVVCNPCSRETKWIKPRNSYKHTDSYALGYVNKSSYKNYKVLRVDYQQHFAAGIYNTEYEIYDLTTDSWKVLGATTDWFLPSSRRPCMSVKGNTYLVACDSEPSYQEFLLSFDFSTEIFEKLSLPHDFHCLCKGLSVVREEELYLYGSFTNDLHVWVTKISDGSVMSWSKLLIVKAIDYDFYCGMSFLATEQNEYVVCCNKFIQVDRQGAIVNSKSCSMLLNYVPSLAQIQQDTHCL